MKINQPPYCMIGLKHGDILHAMRIMTVLNGHIIFYPSCLTISSGLSGVLVKDVSFIQKVLEGTPDVTDLKYWEALDLAVPYVHPALPDLGTAPMQPGSVTAA